MLCSSMTLSDVSFLVWSLLGRCSVSSPKPTELGTRKASVPSYFYHVCQRARYYGQIKSSRRTYEAEASVRDAMVFCVVDSHDHLPMIFILVCSLHWLNSGQKKITERPSIRARIIIKIRNWSSCTVMQAYRS
ncbi:uncharacterized protein EDB91DRAFT_1148139 [Suillus paluster]|uniref:uncharacterized protein n=1 Tax=Suillus paluster TaxID=48578 RepID=UPI001B85C0C3|nr:uncharacterized protein EDB91DRAFT_1148139 [Suillus paluster]KAG1733575.1 hypothetical protein EDB91DRAFT_1148139 [Suillus paluster]